MNAFWRKLPLTDNEQILLDKCLEAHRQATFRENASSQIIKGAYLMNGNDFLKAVASGLGTVGGLHAPIDQAYDVLMDDDIADWGGTYVGPAKMPGWGSSFIKGEADPIVENVMLYVEVGWPEIGKRVEMITEILHDAKKYIYPNMACATAATAVILGMPRELAPVLFLQGRALAWAQICYDITRQPSAETLRPDGEGV